MKHLPAHRRPARRAAAGFTLIEILVVTVIMGILASIAYPSLMGQVRKSRRSDAIAALARVQQAQERWRANNAQYTATLSNLSSMGAKSVSPDGHYTITLSGASATGYTATATAKSTSSQNSDTPCRTMSVQLGAGGTITYTAATCFSR